MRIARALALAVALALSGPATAQHPVTLSEQERRALDGYQRETLVCANYFMLLQRCLTNSSAPAKMILSARNAADDLILTGLATGKAIGLTEDAMQARMKAEGDAIMALVGGDCGQIDVASDQHLKRCTRVAANGTAVLDQYLKEAGAAQK
ncbi:MAG TPA: hypothetical protein PK271_04795 [Hyphomicrobium sp.]|uniref:hypothetical protein n=1 Tax=Hyphomicrobium sp. TaxID=82 RepID=UPI002CE073ED|nr:hypothetical protein [Hyphomicrobium sp.]HRN87899.1 hypothetical protein [Hyphomicrobium sp.]